MVTQEIISFMGILQGKGQVTGPVASQTKSAVQKIDEVFDGTGEPGPSLEELAQMDKVEEIFSRHLTKFPGLLTPASAKKYAQRVVKAAENFASYKQDAINYKSTFFKASLDGEKPTRGRPPKTSVKLAPAGNKKAEAPASGSTASVGADLSGGEILTNFPLRPDYVWKAPIPTGLTKTEVRRLAFHLLGYCPDFDPGEPFWRQEAPAPQGTLPQQ